LRFLATWQIRDADKCDAVGIARVHARAWEAAYQGLLSEAVIRAHSRKRPDRWATYLDGPPDGEHVLVAVEGGHIAGFATARPSPDEGADAGQIEVSALYVEPDTWGVGIGDALLRALLERLSLAGSKTATLWVLAGNTRARCFYDRRGWLPDGAERVHPDRGARELRYKITLDPSA
jgi:GNAT superfamily N-acetyltransferase